MATLRHASELASDIWQDCERTLRQFELAWREGKRPALADHLPADPASRSVVLLELVLTDLEYRLRAGEAATALEYLVRFPALATDVEALQQLQVLEARWRGNLSDASPLGTAQAGGELPGLGKYQLLEEVGRGSFGVVYRAHDTELDRTVALKVLRLDPGLNGSNGADEDRFQREARSWAALHHPNIVPLYEAGRDESCRFLASGFVAGTTLAHRLDAWRSQPLARPDCKESANLALRLTEALEHAHSKGVVHRDLKPANVLLEGPPSAALSCCTPYLCDFGLALRPGQDATLTADGDVLGTPAYLSPEQARGEGHRVDGRSDIFSLGVILYELLTSELPFRGNPRMVLRQVLEEEPRPPRRLNDRIPRDLETICLQCLQKEPGRRYQTAGELGDDLRRFLAGEPVRARPVGRMGRAARWARRKPVVAGLIASLIAALVVGASVGAWQWWRAECNLAQARQEHEQSEEHFRQAFQTVQDLTRFVQTPEVRESLQFPLRKEMLETALACHLRFVEQRGDDPKVRLELARSWQQIGWFTLDLETPERAREAFLKALGLLEQLQRDGLEHPNLGKLFGSTYAGLARACYEGGRHAEGLRWAERALPLWRALRQERPDDPDLRNRHLGLLRSLFAIRKLTGPLSAAKATLEELRDVVIEPSRQDPRDAGWMFQLADISLDMADLTKQPDLAREAFDLLQKAQELWEQDGEGAALDPNRLARIHAGYQSIGKLQVRLGQREEALRTFEKLCQFTVQRGEKPGCPPNFKASAGAAHYLLAKTRADLGRSTEALDAFRAANHWHERALEDEPGHPFHRRGLTVSLHDMGRLLRSLDRFEEALAAHQKELHIREQLARGQSDNLQYRLDLAATWLQLARVFDKLNRMEECVNAYRESTNQMRTVWAKGSREKWQRDWLEVRYEELVAVLRRLCRDEEAEAVERERKGEQAVGR